MKAKIFNSFIIILLLILIIFINLPPTDDFYFNEAEPVFNLYFDLSVPTYIGKINDNWIISDCYHDQIIYSNDLNRPLNEWYVMTDEVNRAHTVASDGEFYLIDDTDNNRILVFKYFNNTFIKTQEFNNIGSRPHYIIYRKENKRFYCWSSLTGEMYIFGKKIFSDEIELKDIKSIESLNGVYVRSFTFIEDDVYFVSGNENSTITVCSADNFAIKNTYAVDDSISGMVQISYINDWYYITVSTDKQGDQNAATILRCKDLSNVSDLNGCDDIYSLFIGGGTPYCIFEIDDQYYLLEHRLPGHSVWKFDIADHLPVNIDPIF